ncbi:MAG: aquaporin family protein [Bacteroidetes bacterium]|nr:aquaporin family protein [Bacteroidota bacterium]
MNLAIAEFTGTALLILLGNGVNANVVLHQSKGNNSGWIVIAFGWGIAVFAGVYVCASLGGDGHLNPAVTIADAVKTGNWDKVFTYIPAQMLGAMTGAGLAWLAYRKHFDATENPDLQLAVFSNAPAIKSTFDNLITEIIGTMVLVFGAFSISGAKMNDVGISLGALNALPVALLVLGIGLSLGGPTGYAINPARDLGPRIMHFILPIKNKRDSDWSYSWIPVVGPVIGAVIAAIIFKFMH